MHLSWIFPLSFVLCFMPQAWLELFSLSIVNMSFIVSMITERFSPHLWLSAINIYLYVIAKTFLNYNRVEKSFIKIRYCFHFLRFFLSFTILVVSWEVVLLDTTHHLENVSGPYYESSSHSKTPSRTAFSSSSSQPSSDSIALDKSQVLPYSPIFLTVVIYINVWKKYTSGIKSWLSLEK